jgi:hypothetical protein
MHKINIGNDQFILYNETFYVKECGKHLTWTTDRESAKVFNGKHAAELALVQNTEFLHHSA